jgi:hypothetical protein
MKPPKTTRFIHTTQLPRFDGLVHQLRDSAYHDGLRGQVAYSPQTVALAQILEKIIEAYASAGSASREFNCAPVSVPTPSSSLRGARE